MSVADVASWNDEVNSEDELAEVLYERYARAIGPSARAWNALPYNERDAWRCVASPVADRIHLDREALEAKARELAEAEGDAPIAWEKVSGEPGVLKAVVQRDGADFHAFAVRVKVKRGRGGAREQVPTGDPEGRLALLDKLCTPERAYRAVEIAGHAGEWVIWMEPFCE